MKKSISLILIITLLFCSCSIFSKKSIVNKDTAGELDGWVYYLNYNVKTVVGSNGAPIYRQKLNGTKTELITDHYCQAITIFDGRIYYANELDNYIWSVAKDGTDRQKLTSKFSIQPAVNGTKLYFIMNDKDKWGLYSLSENNDTVLIKIGAYNNAVFDGDMLYYKRDKTKDASGAICSLNLKTLKETVVYNKLATPLTIKEKILYFSNEEDGKKLYKISTDGSKSERITNYSVSDLIINKDKMYFVSEDNGTKINGGGILYTSGLDGNRKQPLCTFNSCTSISLVGKWIYFTSWMKNPKYVPNEAKNNSPFIAESFRVLATGAAPERLK